MIINNYIIFKFLLRRTSTSLGKGSVLVNFHRSNCDDVFLTKLLLPKSVLFYSRKQPYLPSQLIANGKLTHHWGSSFQFIIQTKRTDLNMPIWSDPIQTIKGKKPQTFIALIQFSPKLYLYVKCLGK